MVHPILIYITNLGTTHLNARLDGLVDGLLEALVGVLDEAARLLRGRPHEERLVEVAVVAAVEHGHVDVHDVPVLHDAYSVFDVKFHDSNNILSDKTSRT